MGAGKGATKHLLPGYVPRISFAADPLVQTFGSYAGQNIHALVLVIILSDWVRQNLGQFHLA